MDRAILISGVIFLSAVCSYRTHPRYFVLTHPSSVPKRIHVNSPSLPTLALAHDSARDAETHTPSLPPLATCVFVWEEGTCVFGGEDAKVDLEDSTSRTFRATRRIRIPLPF